MDKIPDSLLLKLFEFVGDPVSICKLGTISRRWYRLSHDVTLWRRVRFDKQISMNKLWMFIRRPLAVHTLSLRIEGNVQTRKRKLKNHNTLTEAFLTELQQKCPNLKELQVVDADVSNIKLTQLPNSLTFLGLKNSVISFDFFQDFKNDDVLPNLTGLDLGYCHNLSSYSKSVQGLLAKKDLTVLNLKHCFKLSKNHLNQLAKELTKLEILNVSDMENITNDFLVSLSENNSALKKLDISFCRQVDDKGIEALATSCGQLENLNLAGTGVTDKCLDGLCKFSSLKFISLVKTKCTGEGVNKFQQKMVNCVVDHKFSEATEKVGDTFWWISLENEMPE